VTANDLPILVLGAALSLLGEIYGILCIVSPRKMIDMQSRYSTLLNGESASDRATIWQYRIIGLALIVGCAFFLLVIWQALGIERQDPSRSR
jgi:hypothetical protein